MSSLTVDHWEWSAWKFLSAGGALELNVPPTHQVRKGSETIIPCTVTVYKPPVDPSLLLIFWIFQGEEILSYDDTVTTSDDRVSINTTRVIDGDASLSISNVTVTDSGVYTCVILYSLEIMEKSVSLSVYAPPNITITERIAFINKESVLRSSIIGFYPMDIDVKWFRDGKTVNNYSVSTPQRNHDGTYSVYSTLIIIPTKKDRNNIFSCKIQHASLPRPRQKDFQLDYIVGSLELIVPPTHQARMRSVTRIPCKFSVDTPTADPRYLKIFWNFQGEQILSYDGTLTKTDDRFSIDTTKVVDGDVSLQIFNVSLNDSGVYTCLVLYNRKMKEKETSLFVYAPPKITITGRIAVVNKESILCSLITGYYPVDIEIKWFRDGEILNYYRLFKPQRNTDGTYSVYSTVTIKPTEQVRNEVFSCKIQHASLSRPRQKDFELEYIDDKDEESDYTIRWGVAVTVCTMLLKFVYEKCQKSFMKSNHSTKTNLYLKTVFQAEAKVGAASSYSPTQNTNIIHQRKGSYTFRGKLQLP
ncbi:signal-regulatory beta-1-like [Pelobates cultripes]|uniref:Signal-regulatory beta-1-like n=1 Tax=Pelobates cultripes TaxID=61616 RepID=A0AAD1WJC6_PELCU|nr:signal-regulatory beta-1-like [Pelobates cultripes]